MPLLKLDSVSIRHEGAAQPSPVDVSFSVLPGEVVLLLGPSGSGKSTLALALNGLIPHSEAAHLNGTVVVSGLDCAITTVAQLSTHVAMVFQDPDTQIITTTVLDEVCFGPENLLLAVDEVLARAQGALQTVGLWERRNDDPVNLSGGGRQRLALAAALAQGSPLLVLDEPTANLDPEGIEDVHRALAAVVASGERGIVLIEHNLDALASLVDRVVVLDRVGRLVADGTTDEVLRGRADELRELGVWLPAATLAGLRFRVAGMAIAPLPLTSEDLAVTLDSVVNLPEPRTLCARVENETPVVLSARGVVVTRRRTRILGPVDLDVHRGDFLAIVGANGAGKTTLLQVLAGVISPPRGQVRLAGADGSCLDLADTDPARLAQEIGFVFQNPEHQFVRETVADEMRLALEQTGQAAVDHGAAMTRTLGRFGLDEHRDRHPFRLSGGQKRRLSVATALVAGARVLALDEPTFGQDREKATELLNILDELHRGGTTIIVVTHDLQLVAEHATRVAVVEAGRLLRHAPSEEILGDHDLLRRARLRPPPLARAFSQLTRHPSWVGVTRWDALP